MTIIVTLSITRGRLLDSSCSPHILPLSLPLLFLSLSLCYNTCFIILSNLENGLHILSPLSPLPLLKYTSSEPSNCYLASHDRQLERLYLPLPLLVLLLHRSLSSSLSYTVGVLQNSRVFQFAIRIRRTSPTAFSSFKIRILPY